MQKNEIDGACDTYRETGELHVGVWSDYVTDFTTDGSWFDCWLEQEICLASNCPDRLWGLQPTAFSSTVNGVFSLGLKWPGREAHHSSESTVEVKNEWSYTSTTPYVFITCIGTNLRLPYH
jgi:hypothetical protein